MQTSRPKPQRKRILLLDDDADLCAVLSALLEWHSFEVISVQRGVDGLREVMAQDFDAIVCDMFMPTMPGDMFHLAISKTKPHLRNRFVLITGTKDSPAVLEFVSREGLGVLYKPIATQDLVEMIESTIARNEAAMPPAEFVEKLQSSTRVEPKPEAKRVPQPKTASLERFSD